MLAPTPELKSEIGSLQWMNDEQLKKMYAELIPDAQNCAREDVLRFLIAYRLQERFYNLKLSESSKKTLAKTVEGDKLMRASWEARYAVLSYRFSYRICAEWSFRQKAFSR